jgi:hypothetical protein
MPDNRQLTLPEEAPDWIEDALAQLEADIDQPESDR